MYICSICWLFPYFCPQSEQLWPSKGKEAKPFFCGARKAFFTLIHFRKRDCFIIINNSFVIVPYVALQTRLVVLGAAQTQQPFAFLLI